MLPSSEACERNKEPILEVLRGAFAAKLQVLEIGSGTGQHARTYAVRSPRLTWWPIDVAAPHLASIDAYRRACDLANMRAPQTIDLMQADWQRQGDHEHLAAILCFNVIHISPWTVTENLMSGAARHLPAGGLLILYGPYKRDGVHTALSNAAFDASLRARNPDWGVRDLADVTARAQSHGSIRAKIVAMPANKLGLAFEQPSTHPRANERAREDETNDRYVAAGTEYGHRPSRASRIADAGVR